MQISDGLAVIFHFTLTNDLGQILDSSNGDNPLSYIHGSGMIVPGLEKELAGKSAGEKIKVTVDEAMAAIESGLNQNPDNSQLKDDRQAVYFMQRKIAGSCG